MERGNPNLSLKRSCGRGDPPSKTSSSSIPPPRVIFDPSSEARQRKKVKFADSVGKDNICSKHNATSLQTERTQSQIDGAKTLEFKYFTKQWEEAHNKVSSQENCSKTAKESDESHNAMTYESDTRSFLLPTQNVTLITDRISDSCEGSGTFRELNHTAPYKSDSGRCLSPIHKVTPLAQRSSFLLLESPRSFDRVFEHGGIFSEQRRKLMKLAAKTVSLDIDEFLLRRSDIISGFMERLNIKKKSASHEKHSISWQKKPHSKYHTLASSKCDPLEKLHDFQSTDNDSMTSKKGTTKDLLCIEASELIALPWECDNIRAFDFHAVETSLQHNRRSNWVVNEFENSVLHTESKADLSQSLVPYSNSTSLELCSLLTPVEKLSSQLVEWDDKSREYITQLDNRLPLTIYNGSSFPNLIWKYEILDDYLNGRNVFDSLINSCGTILQDRFQQKEDDLFSSSVHGYEIQRKDMPVFDMELYSTIPTNIQCYDTKLRNRLHCMFTEDGHDGSADERSLVLVPENPSYDISSFTNF